MLNDEAVKLNPFSIFSVHLNILYVSFWQWEQEEVAFHRVLLI